MSLFKQNFDFQANFMGHVEKILKRVAHKIIEVKIATPEQDMKQSTDIVIILDSGAVALRIRRDTKHRDLTIRAKNGAAKTEIHKIREGFARWYLYIWARGTNIEEWVLVDLDTMRGSGLLGESRPVKMNSDGYTGFVSYSIAELEIAGAVVHHAKK